MKEDPPPDARCRDKFLVQTVAIAGDSDASNVPTIVCCAVTWPASLLTRSQWQNIEKVSKSSIQERKIRVVFLPADGSTTTPSHQTPHGQVSRDYPEPALRFLLRLQCSIWETKHPQPTVLQLLPLDLRGPAQ